MPGRPLNESPYQCFLCTFVGGEPSSLRKHIEQDHSRSNYFWCKWCGKASSGLDEHITHLEHEQCTDTFEHPCGFEGCTYSDHHPSTFIAHLKGEHKGKTLIPCAYCRRLFTLPPCLISHIQNDCCNRPTSSSSPKSLPKSTRDDEATSSNNGQDSAVSSSTSKPAKKTEDGNKNKKKGVSSPDKRTNKSRNPNDFASAKPAWNPFGLNKDFISANDSDSTGSTLSNENSKSASSSGSSIGQKRKGSGTQTTKPVKRIRPSDNESSENEFSVKPQVYNTWAEWLHKMRKYKAPDDVEVFLKMHRAEHFFKCMQKSCTHSSHTTMDFTLHLYAQHKGQKPKCFYCFASFEYTENLIKHMLKYHVERRWQCDSCLYRASSKTHVKVHQRIFHAGEDVQIRHCARVEVGGMKENCSEIVKEKVKVPCSYNCRVQGCKFHTLITLEFRNHLLEKHKNANYFTCCYCEFETTKLEQLVSHYRRHDMHPYECYYCMFGAELIDDVLTHLCINHADSQIKVLSRNVESAPDLITESVKTTEGSSSLENNLPNGEGSSSSLGMSTVISNDFNNAGEAQKNDKDPKTKGSSSTNPKQTQGKTASPSKITKPGENVPEKNVTDNSLLSCDYCDKTYTYEKAFKNHNKMAHKITITDNYQCHLCDFRSFATSKVVSHAKFAHPGESCEVIDHGQKGQKKNCPKGKKESKPNFICIFCNIEFESDLHLTEHLHSELGYLKFSCELCDFKHYKRNEVAKHFKLKHSKGLPHVKCSEKQHYEDWISRYVSVQTTAGKPSDDSYVPMSCTSHSGLEDDQCKMCKKQFSSRDLLKYHIFQHIQYTPHQCTLCKQKFINLTEVEEHSKSVHHTTKRSTKLSYKPIDKIEQWVAKLLNLPECPGENPAAKKTEKKRRRFPTLETDMQDKNIPVPSGIKETAEDIETGCANNNTSHEEKTSHDVDKGSMEAADESLSISREGVAIEDNHESKDKTASSVERSNEESTIPQMPELENHTTEVENKEPDQLDVQTNSELINLPESGSAHLAYRITSNGSRFSSPFDYDDEDSSTSGSYDLPDIPKLSPLKLDSFSDNETDTCKKTVNQNDEKSSLENQEIEGEVAYTCKETVNQNDEKSSLENQEIEGEVASEETEPIDNPLPESDSSLVVKETNSDVLTSVVSTPASPFLNNSLKENETGDDEKPIDVKMTDNVPIVPTKQTARKSFPTAQTPTNWSGALHGTSCKQTARKSFVKVCNTTNSTDATEKPSCSGEKKFKTTARKSTSKPSRNLQKPVPFHRRRYVYTSKLDPLDLEHVFYVPRGIRDVKIYSHLFPLLFPNCNVILREFKEIL